MKTARRLGWLVLVALSACTFSTENADEENIGAAEEELSASCLVSYDTSIKQAFPTTNFGSNYVSANGASGAIQRGLLKFQLDDCIGTGVTITAATLRINVTNGSATTFDIYKLTRGFAVGEKTNVTWNQASISPWATPGANHVPSDREGTTLASFVPSATGQKSIAFNAEGRAALSYQANHRSSNYGLIISAASTASDALVFDSREGAQPAVLDVTYTTGSAGGSDLGVMTYNLASGRGTDGITNYARQAELMVAEGASVICGNESSSSIATSIRNALITASNETWHAYTYGKNSIFSKVAFSATSGKPLASYGCEQRYVARATINAGSGPVNVLCTHIDTNFKKSGVPCTAVTSQIRISEINEVKAYAATYPGVKIIAGDFNAPPGSSPTSPSPEYAAITGSTNGAYTDVWPAAISLTSATAYPTCNPVGFASTRTRKQRIDFIFVSGASVVSATVPDTRDLSNTNVSVLMENCDDLGVRPSDHNPVVSTIHVP